MPETSSSPFEHPSSNGIDAQVARGHKYLQEALERVTNDPAEGQRLLQRAGIVDVEGHLTAPYRGPAAGPASDSGTA